MEIVNSFYDSHLHFLGIGMNQLDLVDLTNALSLCDVKAILVKEINRDIIVSRGWNQNNFNTNSKFTKQVLNEVSTIIPIVAIRTCGHVLICNDKMLELAGIDESTPQVDGGTFDIMTGIFTENALGLIYNTIPKPSKQRIKEYMIASNEYLLSNGITSCGSDDFSTLNVDYELVIECFKELYEEDKIQLRIYEQINIPDINELRKFINKGYHKLSFGNFKMGPLKLLADGSLGGRTAFLKEPYNDDLSNRGISVFTQDELDELVYLADSNNMDVAIHGIGDGVVDMIIDAIYRSMIRTNRTHHRHSIIHAQLATKKQIQRMYDLNIAAQVQPIFLNSDISIVKNRLGKRSEESYLFKSMYDKGIITAFGTDCPVEPVNPFYNLYCATTRKSIKNKELDPFLIDEAFTIEEALECYNKVPYYLSYDEHKDYNDYIVIDKDVTNCTKEELLEIKVLETYIDGKLVFKKRD